MGEPKLHKLIEIEPKQYDTIQDRRIRTGIKLLEPFPDVLLAISQDIQDGYYSAFSKPSIHLVKDGKKVKHLDLEGFISKFGDHGSEAFESFSLFENLDSDGEYDFLVYLSHAHPSFMQLYPRNITFKTELVHPFCDAYRKGWLVVFGQAHELEKAKSD